ncbi:hypothetical protein [Pleionea sp. CnH1-48]|uniref:hypothetical protein n=1 Tax=Pleionea sp. CnH1-48 TaxID=2954494 RepID=UPI002097C26A|nr:hypothetical protein [Pleionea sp. CnH1-48]MCO7226640.1 hypothetical protein [Pleionea sp. CnH1-48]
MKIMVFLLACFYISSILAMDNNLGESKAEYEFSLTKIISNPKAIDKAIIRTWGVLQDHGAFMKLYLDRSSAKHWISANSLLIRKGDFTRKHEKELESFDGKYVLLECLYDPSFKTNFLSKKEGKPLVANPSCKELTRVMLLKNYQ